ncbi:hypothetical protein INT45_011203 [Circinella minor]|uniref:Uncharacterized protein n=1 Tax=Circinella minor TaxID=1195481 RepID=A0A8H7S4S4_9FUNG|nr:hypothetical protein INT45_011203 [Circinella minor]
MASTLFPDFPGISAWTPSIGGRGGRRHPSCPAQDRETILNMVTKHFHMHPLIDVPGHRTPAQIYIGAAREIYLFCNQRGYIDTWVYLFNEWYNPRAWKTWTRCTAGDRIPMAKTTMLIEAHWKVLKRNHLYHYNRARLNLLVYVIMDRYFPDLRYKFNRDTVIGSHATRWANEFTKEWNRLVGREEKSNANALYEPSTETWTCGSPSFLTSRYLICKYLVRRFATWKIWS